MAKSRLKYLEVSSASLKQCLGHSVEQLVFTQTKMESSIWHKFLFQQWARIVRTEDFTHPYIPCKAALNILLFSLYEIHATNIVFCFWSPNQPFSLENCETFWSLEVTAHEQRSCRAAHTNDHTVQWVLWGKDPKSIANLEQCGQVSFITETVITVFYVRSICC